MAHAFTFKNRRSLLRSQQVGCFYCIQIFSPKDITEYIDNGKTGLCPKCGIDSVVGDASGFVITNKFLQEMRDYRFKEEKGGY